MSFGPSSNRFAPTRAGPQTNPVTLSWFSLTDSVSSATLEIIFNTEKNSVMAKNENIMLDIKCHPRDSTCNGPKVASGLEEDFTS